MPDAKRLVYAFDEPPADAASERSRLLGGKGANLVAMTRDLGLPVPPGFTVTTEACRTYLSGTWPEGLDDELRQHMDRLGDRLGRRFGDPSDPLLVSVRSGAPVSMPGMMDTILNVGLTSDAAAGLARAGGAGEAFATDCARRLREGYRAVIGEEPPDDPWQQLRGAVEAVFRSWQSDRARAYRQREGIPDDLGTAVTVQAMVFGNRGDDSGTGVVFTRDPSTGEPVLYGDVMFRAQGEDVVAGTHAPEPIAVLDERLPAVAAELRRYAVVLERHYADMCDIEFTIEDGSLWLLQVRVGKRSPRAALRMAIDMAEDPAFPVTREEAVRRVLPLLADPPRVVERDDGDAVPVATGLGASPGVATGSIVLTSEDAEDAADTGRPVILVRSETSPEDVRGMAAAAGILTARGGMASHAAVVARGWGIPAVVGATAVRLGDDRLEIDGRVLVPGDVITVDGVTGEVFVGEVAGRSEVAPEAATLLAWARDLGIAVGPRGDGEPDDAGTPVLGPAADHADRPLPPLTGDDVLATLAIKGASIADTLPEVLLADPTAVSAALDELVAARLAERAPSGVRLTAEGKLRSTARFEADRATVGEGRTVEALEAFHAFDGRMKALVTAWQVRDVDGQQALNDHSDPAYDARILDDLAALHADTAAFLGPLASTIRRYAVYRTRLARAMELARGGDQRYVASPRVDSYHSVWFELHEDLIRLAGRKRADEAAAGRA